MMQATGLRDGDKLRVDAANKRPLALKQPHRQSRLIGLAW
jgi:hypothetical protein